MATRIAPCRRIGQDQGYGIQAGIPTMVVAAAPLDDVLSIAGWTI